MQTAHIRFYQGRFFLIPASEVEAFDKCREILDRNGTTTEFATAQLEFVEHAQRYEIQKEGLETLEIIQHRLTHSSYE